MDAEAMKSDSASNEMASVQDMRAEQVVIDGVTFSFRHCLIARDKAHGARRLLLHDPLCLPMALHDISIAL